MLRVTALELPASWGEPQEALARVDAQLAGAPASDVVLLPELSLTGYVSPAGTFDLARLAEPIDGATARGAAALARRHATHLVAPLVLGEDGRVSNAMVCFAPDGALLFCYRKRHPWFPERWATPGPLPPPVVRIGDLQVTIAICFDGHFLAQDARDELARADLLLFPSAWVDEHDTRVPLLTALARRHRIAVANANWGEGVVVVPGQGGSCIVDATGQIVARAPPRAAGADAVATVTASIERR